MKSTFIDNPSINPLGDPKINFTIQYISFYTQISKQTESEKDKFPIKQFPEKPNSTIQITKHLKQKNQEMKQSNQSNIFSF